VPNAHDGKCRLDANDFPSLPSIGASLRNIIPSSCTTTMALPGTGQSPVDALGAAAQERSSL